MTMTKRKFVKCKRTCANRFILAGLLTMLTISPGFAAKAHRENTCHIYKDQSLTQKQCQILQTLYCCYGVQAIHIGQTYRLVIPSNRLFNPDSANLRPSATQLLARISTFINTYTTEQVQ